MGAIQRSMPAVCAAVAVVFVAACSGGGGASGGGSGSVPTGNPSVVAKVSSPPPTSACPTGGATIETGIDANLNGLLDPGEISSTQYVCNGANGTSGTNGVAALASITTEPTGTNCASGGSKVSVGPDTNGSGALDPGEITSTNYICNGANGMDGADSLLTITTEPVGGNCPIGGLKVLSWLDTTANGAVDAGETSYTNYICNSPGTVVIQSISADPSVVRPGAASSLKVTATDGVGSPLSYQWSGPGSFSLATSATMTWTAPATVGSYLVSVLVSNGASTVTGYASIFVSAAPTGPVISSVNPGTVKIGDIVQITGAGFGTTQETSMLTIGGQSATNILSWSDNVISAVVPAGSVSGSVTVNVGGSVSSPGYIVVPWTAGNVPVTTAALNQRSVQIVSDGNGGAIIVWEDDRNGSDSDIYAQRINGSGTVQWAADGVAISTAANYQSKPQIVSDGMGGAIIVWEDFRNVTNADLYAQRVNSSGAVQWAADGVVISGAANNQVNVQLISDGAGGAIMVWEDSRSGTNVDLYAQRVNGSGAVQWTTDGVTISTAANNQDNVQLISDGGGGAIIVWRDLANVDIYAQRVNGTGTVLWTIDGVAISTAANSQTTPQLVSDGAGGAIIAWSDYHGASYDIYAQRVNAAGAALWTTNGVAVSSAANDQSSPALIPDGFGGAIIAWSDLRGGINYDIYAQRVNGAGAVQWMPDGVPVSVVAGDQLYFQLVSDSAGGAIIAWNDNRSGENDIYAQRVSGAAGAALWTVDGMAVSSAIGSQQNCKLVSDGAGGVIIAWVDVRSGTNADIYAQGIPKNGAY